MGPFAPRSEKHTIRFATIIIDTVLIYDMKGYVQSGTSMKQHGKNISSGNTRQGVKRVRIRNPRPKQPREVVIERELKGQLSWRRKHERRRSGGGRKWLNKDRKKRAGGHEKHKNRQQKND